MSEETLFTAARRALRFFRIDMEKGGLMTTETEHAMSTLERMVEREDKRQKEEAAKGPRVVGGTDVET